MTTGHKWMLGCGFGCFGLIAVFMIGCIALAIITPADRTLTAGELKPKDRAFLTSLGLLEPGEEIILFYSRGLFSIKEHGSLFTNRRVATYSEGDTKDTVQQARYGQITDITAELDDSFGGDSHIFVTYGDEDIELDLIVTNTEGHDRKFYNRLLTEWKKQPPAKKETPPAPAEDEAEESGGK